MTVATVAKLSAKRLILFVGAPEGIRTPDLCLRRALHPLFCNGLAGYSSGIEAAFTGISGEVRINHTARTVIRATPISTWIALKSSHRSYAVGFLAKGKMLR